MAKKSKTPWEKQRAILKDEGLYDHNPSQVREANSAIIKMFDMLHARVVELEQAAAAATREKFGE